MTSEQKRELAQTFLADPTGVFYTPKTIEKVLEQTELLHVLLAVKILSEIDGAGGFEIPKLNDLNNLISELLAHD